MREKSKSFLRKGCGESRINLPPVDLFFASRSTICAMSYEETRAGREQVSNTFGSW